MQTSRRVRPWVGAPSIARQAALKTVGLTAVEVVNAAHSGRSAEEMPQAALCWHGSANALWRPAREAQIVEELLVDVDRTRRRRGCDGVIEARLSGHHHGQRTVFEFSGVLVRATGGPYPRGFVTHLGGSELARLIGGGWIPVSLARGVAIGSHHEPAASRGRRMKVGTRELSTWTRLLSETRSLARDDLAARIAAVGAAGALLGTADLDTRLAKCPDHHGHDRIVRAAFVATTVVRFAERGEAAVTTALDLTR